MKMRVGWEEWVALPDLLLPAVKAKIDTGAKTSALHAFNIEPYTHRGETYVRFDIHPLQRRKRLVRSCTARTLGWRWVIDSGGHRERRYVIETQLTLGETSWSIELTLANRDSMAFRMLLGRTALRDRAIVDPSQSFCLGSQTPAHVKGLYR